MEIDVQSVSRWLTCQTDDHGTPIAIIDCREQHEFKIAKIEGALLIPMSQWPPTAEQMQSLVGKRVVVYCHHGGRSFRVANWFRQNGHPDALSMAGGIDRWSIEIDSTVPRY